MEERALESIDPRALGRRLQEARKARGLTQQDAADALSVARTTVTALEKGERRMRPGELIQLARLFGRPVSEFVGPKEPIADFAVQFRRSAGGDEGADAETTAAVEEFSRLCEDYLYLENLNGAPLRRNYPAQYLTDGTSPESAAADIASAERNRLGLGDGPLLRLRDTLESDVGVRVFVIDLPSRVAGLFSYTEELGGCIAVNARHPAERQRWSMSHEYGHFLTNRFQSEISLLVSPRRVPAAERFADAFARCLLMPAPGLQRRFNALSRAVDGKVTAAEVCRVAHQYVVSVEAMMLRLEELRVLSQGTWDRLRDRGFKVREAQDILGLTPHPSGDQLLPLRYQYLAARAYEEGKLTEGQLARLLRVDRVLARRAVQRLTHPLHVLDEGEVASLPVDLASSFSGQGA
ncbi:MAG: ImmA/IrrE family metallo-endopeptidase [Acidobacteria bacterium]|nr:ImmA/IrrE family metallo-endopeptidase [Acidobacteriota bacterium]